MFSLCVSTLFYFFCVAKYAESTESWQTAPSWWRWRWDASGPTGWWTSSSSGSTGTTSTTARCLAASSGTLPTASWGPSSLCPSWSHCWWRPWWCGGASAARGSCSQGKYHRSPFVLKVWIWFTPEWPKNLPSLSLGITLLDWKLQDIYKKNVETPTHPDVTPGIK